MKYGLIVLRSAGQIMLQENAVTGLLFLIGIFYGSLFMGLAAVLSITCGTTTAQILKYDQSEIEKGLYGFSAALVGVALVLFFKPVLILWIFIIAGSVAAAMLQHFFIEKKIPVFTLPFVLVTWVIIFLIRNTYPQLASIPVVVTLSGSENFSFPFRSFGQVIFQSSVFSGIIFFVAVFINSPTSAMYALAASVLAAVLSYFYAAPVTDIEMGLFGYNAVLCAIVFAGNKTTDAIWVVLSVVLSVIIGLIMFSHHLTQLTFPFVSASCTGLLVKNLTTKVFVIKNKIT